jgi:hypothetical protein
MAKTITQVLETSNKKMNPSTKIATIAKLVKGYRKAYGNTEAEIKAVSINTTNGCGDIRFMSDKDKLAAAKCEVKAIIESIKSDVINEAPINKDMEIARLVALNPFFANIATTETISI